MLNGTEDLAVQLAKLQEQIAIITMIGWVFTPVNLAEDQLHLL